MTDEEFKTLSEKRNQQDDDFGTDRYFYFEENVKEFIKRDWELLILLRDKK